MPDNWWLRLRTLLLVALVTLTAAGGVWLALDWPRGKPIELLPPAPTASPAPVRVHVAGEVAAPGVVSLPPGSTVEEAIRAAGGATGRAKLDRLNLAAAVSDGQQVWVPGDEEPAAPPANSVSLPAGGTARPGGMINLNTATAAELAELPGIGEVLAGRIVAYRTTNGPFTAIEEVIEVSGIGPAKFEAIRDLITVGP